MNKIYFRISGAIFLIMGILIIFISPERMTGAVVGNSDILNILRTAFGILFLFLSLILLTGTPLNLEKILNPAHTLMQKRKDGYYLYNTENGEAYNVSDFRELAKDAGLKRELRKEYFSDLIRMYAESHDEERGAYKSFIVALSPNSNVKNLDKRLKQFENVYDKIKDKLKYADTSRISRAKEKDFEDREFVRFENERDTLWPEEGSIGFLPFDEIKVNPARGPRFSVIPVDRLVKDGYLKSDCRTLNGAWSAQKRQDYLKNKYGVDIGSRQRNMVFFKLENGTSLEKFGNYVNILVEKILPLVKITKKK